MKEYRTIFEKFLKNFRHYLELLKNNDRNADQFYEDALNEFNSQLTHYELNF